MGKYDDLFKEDLTQLESEENRILVRCYGEEKSGKTSWKLRWKLHRLESKRKKLEKKNKFRATITRPSKKPVLAIALLALFAIVGILAFTGVGQQLITGLTTGVNETIIENITNITNETLVEVPVIEEPIINETQNITEPVNETPPDNTTIIINENFTEELIQHKAVVGQPVMWTKKFTSENGNTIKTTIPESASNITITKKIGDVEEELDPEKVLSVEEAGNSEVKVAPITGGAVGTSDSGGFFAWIKHVVFGTNAVTGYAVLGEDTQSIVNINAGEFDILEITYETPAPEMVVEETSYGYHVIVSSEVHYENISAQLDIPAGALAKVYWTTGGKREEIETRTVANENTNDPLAQTNTIEWTIPHLSEEEFEIDLIILNIQSYPETGGNWTVAFNTTGTAGLNITKDTQTFADLTFESLKCGGQEVQPIIDGPSVIINNWNCNGEIASIEHTVNVAGHHHQIFNFGGIEADAFNAPPRAATSWQTGVNIDTATSVGNFMDLAIDSSDGLHVCYYDNASANLDLYYAYCDNSAGGCNLTANWASAKVDSGGDVGMECSIAVGTDGHGHSNTVSIIHGDNTNLDFRYSNCTSGCTNVANWGSVTPTNSAAVTPDRTGYYMGDGAVAINSTGGVHALYIYYSSGVNTQLYHNSCEADCGLANGWHNETVIAGSGTVQPQLASITIDSADHLHVATHSGFNTYDLDYAFSSSHTYPYSWASKIIDSVAASTGQWNSIQVDSNNYPWIAYLDTTNTALRIANCSSATTCAGAGAWTANDVETANSVGYYADLAIDKSRDNMLHIVHGDLTNFEWRYTNCTALANGHNPCAAGTAKWTGTNPLGNPLPKEYVTPSMVLDSKGNVHVIYPSMTSNDLRYARKYIYDPNVPAYSDFGIVNTSRPLAVGDFITWYAYVSDNVMLDSYEFRSNGSVNGAGSWTNKSSKDIGPYSEDGKKTANITYNVTIGEDDGVGVWIGTPMVCGEFYYKDTLSNYEHSYDDVLGAYNLDQCFYVDDGSLPTVSAINVNDGTITEADVGVDKFVATIDFSETMDQAVAPTVGFDPAVGTTMTNCAGVWSDTDTYVYTCDVADANVESTDVDIDVSGAKDLPGNTMAADTTTGDDKIDIDTIKPTVSLVSVNDGTLTESDVGVDKLVITIDYSETMSGATAPTVGFDPAVGTTITNCDGVWTDGNTYTRTCDVADANVEQADVDIDVSGAKDAALNTMAADTTTGDDKIDIDTIKPTVDHITLTQAILTEADNGGTEVIDIFFSEAMDQTVAPVLTFNADILGSGTITDSGISGWESGTHYKARYDAWDVNEEVLDVDVIINTAKDIPGNTMAQDTQADKIDVDTVKPTVTLITISDATLTDIDAGTEITIDIDFLEAMDQLTAPVITMNGDIIGSGTLTLDGPKSSWTDGDTYRATYDVADVNEEVADVDVIINAAKDALLNTMAQDTQVDKIDVDTAEPRIPDFNIANDTTFMTQGSSVQWWASSKDAVAVDEYMFRTNDSGAWVNQTFPSGKGWKDISGTQYNVSFNYTIAAAAGTYICGEFYINDTANNWNHSVEYSAANPDRYNNSQCFIVSSTVAIILTDSSVNFGGMSPSGSDNTIDDSPKPITVQNDGGVDADISIQAMACGAGTPCQNLFVSFTNTTKAIEDQYFTTRCGAGLIACPAGSIVNNFIYVPNYGNATKIISDLPFGAGGDKCELEFAILVPDEEQPIANVGAGLEVIAEKA